MIKIVQGSGKNRTVLERADKGREHHEQRRFIAKAVGLLR